MLTLTGAGGVGKTRLALRMAAEVRRAFPEASGSSSSPPCDDPQLVPHTVANTLELRQVSADPAADLAAYLEGQQLLVVLDNCEHLADACAVLASKLLRPPPGCGSSRPAGSAGGSRASRSFRCHRSRHRTPRCRPVTPPTTSR